MQCSPQPPTDVQPGNEWAPRAPEQPQGGSPPRILERRENRSPATEHQRQLNRRTSDVVRACREAAGLDRRTLAERIGVPEQVVTLWEDPTYEGVDLAILRRVAQAAGGELEIRFRPTGADARAAG